MQLPPLSPDQLVKPRRFELRLSLIFAALYVPSGIHMPYFPLWLEEAGLGPQQIAIILSAPMVLRMLTTPLITAYADRAGERANVLILLVALSLVVSLGFFTEPTYTGVLAISMLLAMVWMPHAPLADSLALSGVRRFGSDYSRMRVWGSAAFLAANFIGGLILARMGTASVPVMITAGFAATLVAALVAPRLGRPRLPSPLSAATFQDTSPSLFDRRFLLFVAATGLVTGSHGFLYAFGSIYWKTLAISDPMIGILWSAAVFAEVVMFAVFTRLFGRVPPRTLLAIAGIACLLRWAMFPHVWELGLGVSGFFAIQALHAFTTGMVLLGTQKMITEAIPDHRYGAAFGMVFAANGISMAAVTFASGPLYAALGAGGFHVMACVSAVGLLLLWLSARSAPKRA